MIRCTRAIHVAVGVAVTIISVSTAAGVSIAQSSAPRRQSRKLAADAVG